MDVLVTGAHGTVGTAITEHLGEDHEFTLLDVEPADDDRPGESVVADVTDYEAIRPHFEGRDAVVHLALIPGTGGATEASLAWDEPLSANLEGINNVFEAAVDAGLESIVFASSNHAVGLVERRNRPEVYFDGEVLAGHDEPHRPGSAYGLIKSYGEDLGRLAAEAHGVRFYGLRIGAVREPEYDHPYGDAERAVDEGAFERDGDAYEEQVARMHALWQSRRDCARLVDCCLCDESVEWDHFYGLSANATRWLDDADHARETVGYEPLDDPADHDRPSA
jgi:nucleoside-diphosphate-sugar epimerase